MFTYSFNNGTSSFDVTFWTPFKRFHTCKAATIAKSESYYHNNDKIETRYDYLVSFATPIVLVKTVFINDVIEYNDIYVNDGSFNCSNSTIHQLSRFLRENEHIDTSYCEVKQAIRECDKLGRFDTNIETALFPVRVIPLCRSSLESHAYAAFGVDSKFGVYAL